MYSAQYQRLFRRIGSKPVSRGFYTESIAISQLPTF
jgi:hypothetical protein